jgi:ATP-dependent helicase HepA
MTTPPLFPGQRYLSESEPELGLGIVRHVDRRTVTIEFPGSSTSRTYARSGSPLKRIVFAVGDTIVDSSGKKRTITSIEEDRNSRLHFYIGDGKRICETDIADTIAPHTPFDRFKHGLCDPPDEFDLRFDLLRLHAMAESSPLRGYIGSRIELLPHQLSIVQSVCAQRTPRALLADETGLGKTIEAGLSLARLKATGRVNRACIVVPESLVHQWFVELLRRFTLSFSILTDESPPDATDTNPFLKDQFFIVARSLLDQEPYASLIADTSWDLVIVDEVHHIHHETALFKALSLLAQKQCGLILLSATPEQLGREDHFFRLQLLDPERYPSFSDYDAEMNQWQRISALVDQSLSATRHAEVSRDEISVTLPPTTLPGQDAAMTLTIAELIDLFGTGRAVFRNTRRNVAGFPKRMVDITPLCCPPHLARTLFQETLNDLDRVDGSVIQGDDPRISWLITILKNYRNEKVLVLCTSRTKTETLKTVLQKSYKVETGIFHEQMSIVQRDRQAAWFAQKNGARILICSENGSEGRNFQFCRHLALFDLPVDPELLAQRIGRLDRIGQNTDIHIHVPRLLGTVQEIICRWHHEALGAFAANIPAASRVYEEIEDELQQLLHNREIGKSDHLTSIDGILNRSRELCAQYTRQITDARDRLLELVSCNNIRTQPLIDAIRTAHESRLAQRIMTLLFRHFGIVVEEGEPHTFVLNTEYVTDHSFPLPRAEVPVITYDPRIAVVREEVEFITIDHPMLRDGLELFLSGDHGTSVMAVADSPRAPAMLCESVFLVECIAPLHLHCHRFLPPEPIKILIDHTLTDRTADLEQVPFFKSLMTMPPVPGLEGQIKTMLEHAARQAAERMKNMIEHAVQSVDLIYHREIDRCALLQKRSGLKVRNSASMLIEEQQQLLEYIKKARIRLDALRVIVRKVK